MVNVFVKPKPERKRTRKIKWDSMAKENEGFSSTRRESRPKIQQTKLNPWSTPCHQIRTKATVIISEPWSGQLEFSKIVIQLVRSY